MEMRVYVIFVYPNKLSGKRLQNYLRAVIRKPEKVTFRKKLLPSTLCSDRNIHINILSDRLLKGFTTLPMSEL